MPMFSWDGRDRLVRWLEDREFEKWGIERSEPPGGYAKLSDIELLNEYTDILKATEYLIPDNYLPIRPDEFPQIFPKWRGGYATASGQFVQASRAKRNPGWEIGQSHPTARIPRRGPEPPHPSGKRYEYWPGAMDIADPNVISGRPIARGAVVTIINDRVDPLRKIVWITDGSGNEQSVWRAALRTVGTGKRFGRTNPAPKTWYVPWSSFFDHPPYYAKERIAGIVAKAGGTDVHFENQFGWSNQPEVVVFKAHDRKAVWDALSTELAGSPGALGPIVSHLDRKGWRRAGS